MRLKTRRERERMETTSSWPLSLVPTGTLQQTDESGSLARISLFHSLSIRARGNALEQRTGSLV